MVQLNNRFSPAATPATVLGPFHIDGSPALAFGEDMSEGLPGTPLFITGRVSDRDGRPVPNALLDIHPPFSTGRRADLPVPGHRVVDRCPGITLTEDSRSPPGAGSTCSAR
ncbi:peptidase associated/transthyretin-like domain-containing protein [Amycolatopsis thermoflava]|uniref:hypothetical protein n=1 Tax=Amycolatopsis thermoflava TaxID=84480 RepID=UPI00365C510B